MAIVIYSKNNCVFCTKAKELVKNLGLEYEEKNLEKDFDSNPVKLIEDIGKKVMSMPQIKIDGKLVGYRFQGFIRNNIGKNNLITNFHLRSVEANTIYIPYYLIKRYSFHRIVYKHILKY